MKIKNINYTFAILVCLIILSFSFFASAQNNSNSNIFLDSDQDGLTDQEERLYGTDPQKNDSDNDGYSDGTEIKSGYNPLKPAPNDKLITVSDKSGGSAVANSENLTEDMARKISLLAANSSQEESVSLNDVQAMVNETLNANSNQDIWANIPEITEKDIKIKKQNYGKLSDESAKKKKKEDFSDYITAVFYIMTSNSPKPLTSSEDISSLTSSMTEEIISALDTRDASALEDLSESGEKIIEEMKNVEVPEDMIETHIKALRFAYCAKELKNYINTDSDDPLKDIANISQIKAFITSFMSFAEDTQSKFAQYDLSLDDEEIQEKLKDYGLDEDLIEELTK